MKKKTFKYTPEELEFVMGRMRKAGAHRKKKGAGSYTRKTKHKGREVEEND